MQCQYAVLDTELGYIGLVQSVAGLSRVRIAPSRAEVLESIHTDYPDAVESAEAFGDLPSRLVRYLCGERVTFNDSLDLSDLTGFQRAVLEAARSIPYGEVRLAGATGRQAAGGARRGSSAGAQSGAYRGTLPPGDRRRRRPHRLQRRPGYEAASAGDRGVCGRREVMPTARYLVSISSRSGYRCTPCPPAGR
jgi:O6-methylguanine-DNA--protein-cysteine methyltransferase